MNYYYLTIFLCIDNKHLVDWNGGWLYIQYSQRGITEYWFYNYFFFYFIFARYVLQLHACRCSLRLQSKLFLVILSSPLSILRLSIGWKQSTKKVVLAPDPNKRPYVSVFGGFLTSKPKVSNLLYIKHVQLVGSVRSQSQSVCRRSN